MAQRKGAKASKAAKPKASKAAAAKAEAQAEAKQFEWHGLTLHLPDEMPGELMFDFYDFEQQQRNGEGRIGAMLSLVHSLVGDEQFLQIRRKVKAEKLTIEKTLEEVDGLLGGLLERYGMGLGES